MKVRQSASLVAGVCTLCVAASGSVTPLPVAAAAEAKSVSPVVSRPFELTAASTLDPGAIAALPIQNLITILQAFAGVAGGGDGLGGAGAKSLQALPNLVYTAYVTPTATNNSTTVPASIQAAFDTEATALQNLGTLPQRLLAFDLAALFGPTATAASTPALKTAAVTSTAAVDPGTIAALPIQNLIAVLQAFAGVAGGGDGLGGAGAKSLQALPNLIYTAYVTPTATNNSTTVPASIQAAFQTEVTALQNLGTLPQRLLALNLGAFTGPTATAASTPALKTAAVTSTAAVDPGTIAALPIQNTITVLQAFAGVAGGGDGLGGAGATSLQALPNVVYTAYVTPTATNNSTTVPASITKAFDTEVTAFKNLGTLPQRIIDTDLSALTPTTPKSAVKTNDVSSPSANKAALSSGTNATAASGTKATGGPSLGSPLKNVRTALRALAAGSKADSTDPESDPGTGRHAKKDAADGASASADKDGDGAAKKPHYVGKHRAESNDAKPAKGSDS